MFRAAIFLVVLGYLFHRQFWEENDNGIATHSNNYIEKIYQDALTVDVWQTLKKVDRRRVRKFEREHECCGFNNVFDHCEDQYRLNIIYQTVEHNSMGQFLENVDEFDDYSSMDDWNRAGNVDYSDYSAYSDYLSSLGDETIVSKHTICDDAFALADPPYYHMPCRADALLGDRVPPRNVSQACLPGICHLLGCKDAYYNVIGLYVETVQTVFACLTVVYMALVVQVAVRRIREKFCSQYSPGSQSNDRNSCCCSC